MMMMGHMVEVRRETIAPCVTCPLCNKLLKEATTISLCLHTFCRKCIYEKLSEEEADSCPVCNINLGCIPVEKLRPDHNLQDIRAKIFPIKRRKIKAPEVLPSISLPLKRKERSLSSLVVNTPKVSMQAGVTGRRTKSVTRKAAALRGSSFSIEEPIKKEQDLKEDFPESSSSPETVNKIIQHKRQSSSTSDLIHDQKPNKDTGNDAEAWEGNVDLWKPLNYLVEVANRTKPSKLNSQGSSPIKTELLNATDCDAHVPKSKVKEHQHKAKVQEDKNKPTLLQGPVKRRRLRAVGRKNASNGLGPSPQAMLDAKGAKQNRRNYPIWFSLVASEDQEGDVTLPQISACYLRIKWR
ncbi:E3 ubiquitin protein ligase DRIP2-like isoform X2 [Cornus florida]|uniref:E3 ubiquitin protein ligase DRIP2-like isoform X2 n=1 Tax=Cornus florida TaxID=4283 RepID=UPI0028967818|nr:E3 ubiquitin protein ligase DRIP2-like isoform X2 [Cornus florida]